MIDLALLVFSLVQFASAMTKDELMATYPNCTSALERVSAAQIGNGICDLDYNILECGWDGGDCIVEGYPDCHVSNASLIGNGVCDILIFPLSPLNWFDYSTESYNTKECGGDGGDCPHPDGFPNCYTYYPETLGDGFCNYEFNNEECGRDGGDCPAIEGYPECYVSNPEMVGDFECDFHYNTEECGWDGGDCLVEGYPDCHPEFDGEPNELNERIGNGICDSFLYSEGCEWDGGDCDPQEQSKASLPRHVASLKLGASLSAILAFL